ncbi:TIGR04197 family type VII secretion effector [Gordonibacter sp. An230]|uniref:TIGR04197 family type VII secretion effector n=1 Tax=Gordonibacter sp. An230 TaxID=1965592 RepID=UPI0013A60B7F|nr:TIGR04197 family type VII secretion effector [Gordonibacter sp. An230]
MAEETIRSNSEAARSAESSISSASYTLELSAVEFGVSTTLTASERASRIHAATASSIVQLRSSLEADAARIGQSAQLFEEADAQSARNFG